MISEDDSAKSQDIHPPSDVFTFDAKEEQVEGAKPLKSQTDDFYLNAPRNTFRLGICLNGIRCSVKSEDQKCLKLHASCNVGLDVSNLSAKVREKLSECQVQDILCHLNQDQDCKKHFLECTEIVLPENVELLAVGASQEKPPSGPTEPDLFLFLLGLGGGGDSVVNNVTNNVLESLNKTFGGIQVTNLEPGASLDEVLGDDEIVPIFQDVHIILDDSPANASTSVPVMVNGTKFMVDLNDPKVVFNPGGLVVGGHGQTDISKEAKKAIIDEITQNIVEVATVCSTCSHANPGFEFDQSKGHPVGDSPVDEESEAIRAGLPNNLPGLSSTTPASTTPSDASSLVPSLGAGNINADSPDPEEKVEDPHPFTTTTKQPHFGEKKPGLDPILVNPSSGAEIKLRLAICLRGIECAEAKSCLFAQRECVGRDNADRLSAEERIAMSECLVENFLCQIDSTGFEFCNSQLDTCLDHISPDKVGEVTPDRESENLDNFSLSLIDRITAKVVDAIAGLGTPERTPVLFTFSNEVPAADNDFDVDSSNPPAISVTSRDSSVRFKSGQHQQFAFTRRPGEGPQKLQKRLKEFLRDNLRTPEELKLAAAVRDLVQVKMDESGEEAMDSPIVVHGSSINTGKGPSKFLSFDPSGQGPLIEVAVEKQSHTRQNLPKFSAVFDILVEEMTQGHDVLEVVTKSQDIKKNKDVDFFLSEEHADQLAEAIFHVVKDNPDLGKNPVRMTFNTRLTAPFILLDYDAATVNAAVPLSSRTAQSTSDLTKPLNVTIPYVEQTIRPTTNVIDKEKLKENIVNAFNSITKYRLRIKKSNKKVNAASVKASPDLGLPSRNDGEDAKGSVNKEKVKSTISTLVESALNRDISQDTVNTVSEEVADLLEKTFKKSPDRPEKVEFMVTNVKLLPPGNVQISVERKGAEVTAHVDTNDPSRPQGTLAAIQEEADELLIGPVASAREGANEVEKDKSSNSKEQVDQDSAKDAEGLEKETNSDVQDVNDAGEETLEATANDFEQVKHNDEEENRGDRPENTVLQDKEEVNEKPLVTVANDPIQIKQLDRHAVRDVVLNVINEGLNIGSGSPRVSTKEAEAVANDVVDDFATTLNSGKIGEIVTANFKIYNDDIEDIEGDVTTAGDKILVTIYADVPESPRGSLIHVVEKSITDLTNPERSDVQDEVPEGGNPHDILPGEVDVNDEDEQVFSQASGDSKGSGAGDNESVRSHHKATIDEDMVNKILSELMQDPSSHSEEIGSKVTEIMNKILEEHEDSLSILNEVEFIINGDRSSSLLEKNQELIVQERGDKISVEIFSGDQLEGVRRTEKLKHFLLKSGSSPEDSSATLTAFFDLRSESEASIPMVLEALTATLMDKFDHTDFSHFDLTIQPILHDEDVVPLVGRGIISDIPNDDIVILFNVDIPKLPHLEKDLGERITLNRHQSKAEMRRQLHAVLHTVMRKVHEHRSSEVTSILFDMRNISSNSVIPQGVVHSIVKTVLDDKDKSFQIIPILAKDGISHIIGEDILSDQPNDDHVLVFQSGISKMETADPVPLDLTDALSGNADEKIVKVTNVVEDTLSKIVAEAMDNNGAADRFMADTIERFLRENRGVLRPGDVVSLSPDLESNSLVLSVRGKSTLAKVGQLLRPDSETAFVTVPEVPNRSIPDLKNLRKRLNAAILNFVLPIKNVGESDAAIKVFKDIDSEVVDIVESTKVNDRVVLIPVPRNDSITLIIGDRATSIKSTVPIKEDSLPIVTSVPLDPETNGPDVQMLKAQIGKDVTTLLDLSGIAENKGEENASSSVDDEAEVLSLSLLDTVTSLSPDDEITLIPNPDSVTVIMRGTVKTVASAVPLKADSGEVTIRVPFQDGTLDRNKLREQIETALKNFLPEKHQEQVEAQLEEAKISGTDIVQLIPNPEDGTVTFSIGSMTQTIQSFIPLKSNSEPVFIKVPLQDGTSDEADLEKLRKLVNVEIDRFLAHGDDLNNRVTKKNLEELLDRSNPELGDTMELIPDSQSDSVIVIIGDTRNVISAPPIREDSEPVVVQIPVKNGSTDIDLLKSIIDSVILDFIDSTNNEAPTFLNEADITPGENEVKIIPNPEAQSVAIVIGGTTKTISSTIPMKQDSGTIRIKVPTKPGSSEPDVVELKRRISEEVKKIIDIGHPKSPFSEDDLELSLDLVKVALEDATGPVPDSDSGTIGIIGDSETVRGSSLPQTVNPGKTVAPAPVLSGTRKTNLEGLSDFTSEKTATVVDKEQGEVNSDESLNIMALPEFGFTISSPETGLKITSGGEESGNTSAFTVRKNCS